MSAMIAAFRQATELAPFTAPQVARPKPLLRRVEAIADGHLHPAVVGIALGGYGLFLVASWAGWAFGTTALLIAVIYFLSAMYFGMMILGGQASAAFRGETNRRSFREFLAGRVETPTGWIGAWDALAQIAFLPVMLGCAMCVFAALWLGIRG